MGFPLIAALGLVLINTPALAQNDWQQVKQNSSVTVFTKQVSGEPYKAFKAVANVPATSHEILKVLNDVNRYPQWFAYSASAQLLNQQGTEKYVYIETNFPWPFRNEDMVYKQTVSHSQNGDIKMYLVGMPNFIPITAGVNRMRQASGYILLQPQNAHTVVTYMMHTQLSGEIPPWLANKNIHFLPFETLNNLIERSQSP